jgi:hypothetical protein
MPYSLSVLLNRRATPRDFPRRLAQAGCEGFRIDVIGGHDRPNNRIGQNVA